MELGAPYVSAAHYTGDGYVAILRCAQRAGRAVLGIEAVDIVDVFVVFKILKQRIVLDDLQAVPSHVGHLQALVLQVIVQIHHLSRHKAQTGDKEKKT